MTPTLRHAQVLWDFLSAGRGHAECELLIVCGSYDLRVCDYACELLDQGVAEHIVFSGNTGNWTRHLWERPEAEIFAERAMALGVRPEQFSLEARSTNFAENIAFTRELFPHVRRATFLTKPNSIRRVKLTLPIRWPELTAWVDAPGYRFPDGVANVVGLFGLIAEMVGDVQRIKLYPQAGFQVAQELPEAVEQAWQFLVEQGFDHHKIRTQRD
ncbi:YdcF family protein [Ectopseudomonas mendocina]|uniref:YdcF family protein n=1 Tax=Ectopseudomonas mendocina TaxID=300 RepID=A0ABZ2REA8_ECTME